MSVDIRDVVARNRTRSSQLDGTKPAGSAAVGFLETPSRYLFFTGKGGVGKTALACATSLRLADAGKKVLLVSTDPASNLDEMLGATLSNHASSPSRWKCFEIARRTQPASSAPCGPRLRDGDTDQRRSEYTRMRTSPYTCRAVPAALHRSSSEVAAPTASSHVC